MTLRFGKYKGLTVVKVAEEGDDGIQYLEWLRENTDTDDPKYGKQNAQLVAEINRVLHAQGQPNPKAPVPVISKNGNQATAYLKEIAATLKRIETILANPGRVHTTPEELSPSEEVPF